MASPHAELLENFAAGPMRLTAALVKAPKTMWHWRPAPGKWSIHEVVIHLADCEAHFYVRARHGLAEPGHIISAFDENLWATNLDYHAQDADDALAFIRLGRKFTAALLATMPASIPEDAWQRSFEHPERGTITVEGITRHYVGHDETHINQINRTLAAWQAEQKAAAFT